MGKAVVLTMVLLTGCATTPTAPERARQVPPDRLFAFQTHSPKLAAVTLTRDHGFVASACYFSAGFNGVHAARFDVGETATFFLPAGEIVMRVGRDQQGRGLCAIGRDEWTQRETTIQAGEGKRFRLTIDQNGKADIVRGD